MSPSAAEHDVAAAFVEWLESQVIDDATGRSWAELDIAPGGRFWLGTLASEEVQLRLDRGERGERLDPSAVGLRFQPAGPGPWPVAVAVEFTTWSEVGETWVKSEPGRVAGVIEIANDPGSLDVAFLDEEISTELEKITGAPGLTAEVRVDSLWIDDRPSVELTLVNTSPEKIEGVSTHLFETRVSVKPPDTVPFELEALPDSFRFDRRVPAYGINSGIEADGEWLRTTDVIVAEQRRPSFWNADDPAPDLSFATLAADPVPALSSLVQIHARWGTDAWGDGALEARADRHGWTDEMRDAARSGRDEFEREQQRLAAGLAALENDDDLLHSFKLMNEAMRHSSRGRYDAWRPFQIGFVLATVPSVADPTGTSGDADVVWFATGGGKTETYLGLVMMAAIHDRLTGKSTGVTAWSRFPLRLLSLQQTQRFADAMAGAELVRRREELGGEPFSVGFLVGESSTPNRIAEDPEEDWRPDPEDPEMPARFRVLLDCPFCFEDRTEMAFEYEKWTLEHRCANPDCPWPDEALPFYVVDDEIYRFLPTVIVGTLDKIASISMQASMHGLIAPPRGVCSQPGHGHVYAKRSTKPTGCLVPGCERPKQGLPMQAECYGPTFRLQDELHLLRDSLGAIDAHYEALVDDLQLDLTGTQAKILGSSATLSGYEHQVDVLYGRAASVFPAQGPSAAEGFWTAATEVLARRHVAVAPRGATHEFANDRILTIVQQAVRRLGSEPEDVCSEAGVPVESAEMLLDLYGTQVVYGNTLRDLDAAARSLETQVPVEGALNTASLTGQTDFEEVRAVLDRLQEPEPDFEERIHVVTASSMMSHGVDIDRLNTMVVLGLPLTTAEYIQTTARVGRTWPGVVFVLHKMARERDATTYRAWQSFVTQGDRFVESIPITRRSKRVLESTLPGLLLGRVLHMHETRYTDPLTTVRSLRKYQDAFDFDEETEYAAIVRMLRLDDPLDEPVRVVLASWLEAYFENLGDPAIDARFPSQLCPQGSGPMRSLRDVEETAPVRDIILEERRR